MKATLVLLTALATFASAKGPTTRITVKGTDSSAAIEITRPERLAKFNIWAGPATSSDEPQSLIIDWSKGPTAAPSKELARYEVSFYAKLPEERLAYVVTYCFDPAAGQGYVYLPGRNDPRYALNASSVLHFNEGNWFHAWQLWDDTVRPLISRR